MAMLYADLCFNTVLMGIRKFHFLGYMQTNGSDDIKLSSEDLSLQGWYFLQCQPSCLVQGLLKLEVVSV